MSVGLARATDAVCRAECGECEWTHSRRLDDGETLSAETNREIVESVARHHAHFKCPESDDVADVNVTLDARSG